MRQAACRAQRRRGVEQGTQDGRNREDWRRSRPWQEDPRSPSQSRGRSRWQRTVGRSWRHATAAGRQAQGLSLLRRQSPQGRLQGPPYASDLRYRGRQDRAEPSDGQLRQASARLGGGDQAGPGARLAAVLDAGPIVRRPMRKASSHKVQGRFCLPSSRSFTGKKGQQGVLIVCTSCSRSPSRLPPQPNAAGGREQSSKQALRLRQITNPVRMEHSRRASAWFGLR